MVKFNPEKTLYRDPTIKERIKQTAHKVYEKKQLTPEKLRGMFGTGDVNLTDDEVEKFRNYVQYVGKRIVNAALVSPDKKFNNREEVLAELKKHRNNFGGLALHDLSHTFVAYEANAGKTNSIVPSFLLEKKGEDNRRAIYEEEVYALLWWNAWGEYPILISLMDTERINSWYQDLDKATRITPATEAKDVEAAKETIRNVISNLNHSDFESVLSAYETIVLALVKVPAVRSYLQDNDFNESGLDSFREEYNSIASGIKRDRNPLFVKTAKDVFEKYKTDPKILFHKFEEMCSPLLNRLARKQEG